MVHTNLSIERPRYAREALEIAKLRAELEFWMRHAEGLQDEIENIPRAIERYGHIDISHEGGRLTLIAKPEDPSDV